MKKENEENIPENFINVICQMKNKMPEEFINQNTANLEEKYRNIINNCLNFTNSEYEDDYDVNKLLEDLLKKRLTFKVNNKKLPKYILISKKIKERLSNTILYLAFITESKEKINDFKLNLIVYGMNEIVFEELIDFFRNK